MREDTDVRIVSTNFTENEANRAGGGIENRGGNLVIRRGAVNNNVVNFSPGNGGGIHTGGGTTNIAFTEFARNTAGQEGGGLWSGGDMTLNQVRVFTNFADGMDADDGGAGIFNNSGNLSINASTISSNEATNGSSSGGGLLSLVGDVTVTNSTFESNFSQRAGGAIEIVEGNLTSTNTDYISNSTGSSPGNGGAIHVTGTSGGTVDITGGSIMDNTAANEGGGVWGQNGSTMNLTSVAVMNNTAGTNGGGGVFVNGGTVNVMQSTIAGNMVDGTGSSTGGGLKNTASGTLNVTNSTVSGNDDAGVFSLGTTTVMMSTIALNEVGLATSGMSGVVNFGGNLFAGNTNGSVETGGVYSSTGYNLFPDDPQTTDATDLDNANPGVGPLQNNGGATMTHAIDCSSDAVDANPNGSGPDQIVQAVFGGTRDIGAFELQQTCPTTAPFGTEADDVLANLSPEFSVFPNPVSGNQVNVRIPESTTGQVTLRLVDGNGRFLGERRAAAGVFRFPLEDLPTGSYTLQLVSDTGVSTQRFVVTH